VNGAQAALALPVVVALSQERDRFLAGSELARDRLLLREVLAQTDDVLLAQLRTTQLELGQSSSVQFGLRHLHEEPHCLGKGQTGSIAKNAFLSRREH